MMIQRLCVFCGSKPGVDEVYQEAASALGRYLAQCRIGLVYGGASVGLMGTLADAVLRGGGEVIGVIPRALAVKEIAHKGVADLRIVGSMHERKTLMAELAGAFLAMPGGYGTLDELFEVLTWTQLGLHRKPCGLLNVDGFFDPLIAYLDGAVGQGFLKPEHRNFLIHSDHPADLVDRLANMELPQASPWIRPDES
jgi:uncharacterized protein (TIGR00730 family)